ncbi:helix-turn-helix domain-containing protein [Terrabacter sp. RAF57]|uniref:helix-turn-helix domain-containing protein n=1 Tax=Terrabacter sp. RAF57 TaxID=3233063 RepID=UPI003F9C6167
MSTSATDLLDRADTALAQLQTSLAQVDISLWESLDQTVYRVLHELVRARTGWPMSDPHAEAIYRIFIDYPHPLRPADDQADFSTKEAARLLGTHPDAVRERICAGTLLAAPTGNGYRIPRTELAVRTDVYPASTDERHPMAKLAYTLGALGDLLVTNRLDPGTPELSADSATTMTQKCLALTAAAATHTLSRCDPEVADRPLALARFATRQLAQVAHTPPPMLGLQNPTIPPSEHSPESPVSDLERSLHLWAIAARDELREGLPSVEVFKDINRQAIHIYAALDSVMVRGGAGDSTDDVHRLLRSTAAALQLGADAWSQTSTGMPPTSSYVEAARRLYTTLTTVTQLPGRSQPDDEARYQALLRGANAAAWIASLAAPWASRLLDSGVLFIHARHAAGRPETLTAKRAGRMIAATRADVPALFGAVWHAEGLAVRAARELPHALSQPIQAQLESARIGI